MRFGPDKGTTSSQFLSEDAEDSVRDDHATSSVQADIALSASPFVAREGGGFLTPNFRDEANCGAEYRRMADDPLLLFAVEAEVTGLQRPEDFSGLSKVNVGTSHWVLSPQARPEVAKTESAVWADLRAQLRETELAVRQSVAEGAAPRGPRWSRFEALPHSWPGTTSQDPGVCARGRGTSGEGRGNGSRSRPRLGPLAALQDLSRHTDERFEALKALAEEVTIRGRRSTARRR